ncbi:hypothetical protein [Demetria terragena]|uniref:hypothetical protein n=1 Tax=Demetria terragena TaxID=63959 RepID=UPI0003738FDC|nr:hypothetical protein [Demetria terragena]
MMSEPQGVTRRVVTRTTWTIPAMVVLPKARADAASCPPLPSVAFRGEWSDPNPSGFDTSTGFVGFVGDTFGASADADPDELFAFARTELEIALEPGRSYQISFPVLTWTTDSPRTLTVQLTDGFGSGAQSTTFTTEQPNPGTLVHVFEPDEFATATLAVTVSLSFLGPPAGDDVLLGSPTLTCV